MTLNQRYQLMQVFSGMYSDEDEEYHKIGGANRFKVKLWDKKTSTSTTANAFFKFSPLMDPSKYLVGKYKNLQERTPYDIFRLPSWHDGNRAEIPVDQKTSRKIDTPHNTAYVDSFFSYLTSMAKHNHNLLHGIDYYGSFIGIHPKFPFNAFDDIEYLDDSPYFHEHKALISDGGLDNHNEALFEVESCIYDYIDEDSRKNKRPLKILREEQVDERENREKERELIENGEEFETLDESMFQGVFTTESTNSNGEFVTLSTNSTHTLELLWNEQDVSQNKTGSNDEDNTDTENTEDDNQQHDSESASIESSDSEDDESETGDESDGESDSGDESGSDNNSESSSESDEDSNDSEDDEPSMLGEDEHVWVKIRDFPVDIICLESMEGTLDSLMEKDVLDTNEWISCLAQVVLQLIAYQKMFGFTHNDLHTNNIMYIHTDKKYLFYKVGGKHYRIPTFGRLYKIIDFGRAIYTYRGVRICSDSYHRRGDAASQYNTEPYYDPSRPRLEPNPAFDLVRLGCSLYDFFIDDYSEEDKYVAPLERMIIDWCYDDKKRNVLYSSSGIERYPGFKLYRMIARDCHRQTPFDQFTKQRVFQTLIVNKKKIPQHVHSQIMNLDDLPNYQLKA